VVVLLTRSGNLQLCLSAGVASVLRFAVMCGLGDTLQNSATVTFARMGLASPMGALIAATVHSSGLDNAEKRWTVTAAVYVRFPVEVQEPLIDRKKIIALRFRITLFVWLWARC